MSRNAKARDSPAHQPNLPRNKTVWRNCTISLPHSQPWNLSFSLAGMTSPQSGGPPYAAVEDSAR